MPGRMDVEVRGDRELRRRLGRLHGREFLSTMNTAARASMLPVVDEARELVPVRSGALRDSLGVMRRTRSRIGEITVSVGPRKKFKRTTTDTRSGVTLKVKETWKGVQRSDRGRQSPIFYAHFIEFGRTKDGKRVRKAGPARFLRGAIDNQRSQVNDHLRRELWRRIHRLATA